MHYSEDQISSLILRFEAQRLPKIEWTHEAHLTVAIWYSLKHDFNSSLMLVRKLIVNHNQSVGTPNSNSEGYHETITKFWLLVARDFIKGKESMPVVQLCNRFIESGFAGSNFPLEYYSPGLLFSVEARLDWVKPDLRGFNPLIGENS